MRKKMQIKTKTLNENENVEMMVEMRLGIEVPHQIATANLLHASKCNSVCV